ncbi:MAG: TolC family protein, partial [Candidatus Limnocylindrus sp.]
TLLAQRADVQAAAERVGAAEARLRAAWLAFLPSLGVSAQAGQQANWIREPNAQFVWGVGANLSVPLFGGGQRISQLRQASSQAAAAAASLRQVKLRVAQGIAGAQARFDGAAAQREAARTQRVAANLALDVARERYAAGLANYQAVQIALNTSLQSELTVLASERQVIDATLVLYDAISGPWAASILDVYEGNAP